jgi:hypothetical protein
MRNWQVSAFFILTISIFTIYLRHLKQIHMYPRPTAPKQLLFMEITPVFHENMFRLEITNKSERKITTPIYRWCYELKLYTRNGDCITQQAKFEEHVNMEPPYDYDFHVLKPGAKVSVTLYAYSQEGRIIIPSDISKAECIYRPYILEGMPRATSLTSLKDVVVWDSAPEKVMLFPL